MNRLFDQHKIRKTVDLNGNWKFKLDPDNIGIDNCWFNGLTDAETVIVPSCWNNELRLLNYEGVAWYQKEFEVTTESELLFEFGSVMTMADIWIDDVKTCNHYGAFTEFSFKHHVNPGTHTLTVRVDSSFDAQSFPQRYTDWFNYGGIAREVSYASLNGICIINNHIVYTLSDDLKSVKVHAELELYNACSFGINSNLTISLGDTEIYNDKVEIESGYTTVTLSTPEVIIDDISLWDVGAPKLYTVVAKTDTDDLIDKVGFRKIEVKDNNILLNGKSIELLGVNRHEEHPDWGFAFPHKLMKKDIDLILDMNCNTIRGSHYPQSHTFVDMLDEKGILFWSEIPMWGCGFGEKALQDPVVVNRGLEMHKEMTKYYYNHPSIIIWGMHNEIWTSWECTYDISKKYSEVLRRDGGNRLITHACHNPLGDTSMEFDDIVCINLYHGWYEYNGYPKTMKAWEILIEQLRERLASQGWSHKPVIISEFGAAALAGFHSHFDSVRWSEEYQRDLLDYTLNLFHNTDYMRGTYIWQFCNIRTSPEMNMNRVRYFNNKGIVDEYRNPKAAYFKVKELYGKFAKEQK